MKTIEVNIYTFNELSDKAKEKAIQDYKNTELDYVWWDCVYDEYKEIIRKKGFHIDSIFCSGFYSQGDGAMFTYTGIDDKLRLEFIEQLNLSKMRKQWLVNNTYASGRGEHTGLYYHSKSCKHFIYWEISDSMIYSHYPTFSQWLLSFEDAFKSYVIELYESLCDDLYRALQDEYEYKTSDEYISEVIIANEYDFYENGKRYTQ